MRPSFRILAMGLGLLVGCVRPPEVNPPLQPMEAPDRWLKGSAYLKQTRGGVEVEAAFVGAGPGALLFDVVVANRGAVPVLVTPEVFACELSLPETSLAPREVLAVDPEAMIRQLHQASAAERSSLGVSAAFRGVFLLADLGDALSQSSRRSSREQREVRQEQRETSRDLDAAEGRSEARLTGLVAQRRHWEEDCVRKTTLDPGYGLRGKVVVHANTRLASQVVLRIPVGVETFRFAFRPR